MGRKVPDAAHDVLRGGGHRGPGGGDDLLQLPLHSPEGGPRNHTERHDPFLELKRILLQSSAKCDFRI